MHTAPARSLLLRAVAPALACAALSMPALAQPVTFTLAGSGCPMSHCDSRMSDATNLTIPAQATAVHIDRQSPGASLGLGCVSNGTLAACSGNSDPTVKSNLTVYNADGKRIWDDGGILGSTAWISAPIMSTNGQVIAVDQQTLLRADPVAKKLIWRSTKVDTGKPISPVLVGSNASMVLLATASSGDGTPGEVSVWDIETGALLSHMPIIDPDTARVYSTANTPAVRGNRAYLLTAADVDSGDGRLYAYDVCESQACGGRGQLVLAWHYDFTGPSGASPLLIGSRLFFDGVQRNGIGYFFGVDDLGTTAARVWSAKFDSYFSANAAQDPRGGLWVFPWQTGNLLRLNENTGAIDQTVAVGTVLGLDPSYSPVTAVTASRSDAGAVVLTVGVKPPGNGTTVVPYIAAIDVSSTQDGTMLWKYKVAASVKRNSVTGQFPIVVNAAGSRRVVLRGGKSGTFFIGEP